MITGESNDKGIEGMLTVSDAAKLLGVTRARVLQFIDDARLPATKVTPKLYLLDAADVKRFSRIPRRPGRKHKNSA